MGVPFGTDDFIDNHVSKLIDNYIGDLQALQYFDKQAAVTQLRVCINTRPPFLARCLPLERADRHFKLFDEKVTQQILTIAGVSTAQRSDQLVTHVHNLRGLEFATTSAQGRTIAPTLLQAPWSSRAAANSSRLNRKNRTKTRCEAVPQCNSGIGTNDQPELRKTWRHSHHCWRQTNHLGCDGHLSCCTFHGHQAQLSSHPRCCGCPRGQEENRKLLTRVAS